MKKNLLLILSSLLLVACQGDVVYSKFGSIPSHGWEADSALYFAPCINDTTADYQLQMTLRHTDAYSYQNLWLFIQISKDSVVIDTDTIECYLANDRGEWLGGGLTIHELPLLFEEHYHFDQTGEYSISIQQGMRSDTLSGIKEVGVKIINNGKE